MLVVIRYFEYGEMRKPMQSGGTMQMYVRMRPNVSSVAPSGFALSTMPASSAKKICAWQRRET